MLVKDGVVDKMFIEPDLPGDPFEVSDADTMLAYLAPEASAPEAVSISLNLVALSVRKPRRC